MSTDSKYIIAPREICRACTKPSGPKFSATQLVKPSESPMYRSQQELRGAQRQSKVIEIENMELEILQLEKEIERLEGSLETLKTRHEGLKKHARNEKTILSPVRLLTDDLLGEIFVLSYDSLITPVLNVEEVCIHWRNVAHSTTRLWSDIFLPVVYPDFPGELQHVRSMLYKCIKLSGEASMTLRFPQYGYDPETLGESCIRALAGCAHRWRVIDNINMGLLRAVVAVIPEESSLDRLTRLKLTRIGGSLTVPTASNLVELSVSGLGNEAEAPSILLHSTPSLTTVTFATLAYRYRFFPNFPWGQITDFTSRHNVTYLAGELLTIMQAMTNLSSLSFYGDTRSASSMVLPQVRLLAMDSEVMRPSSNILDILVLPNLRTLHANIRWRPADIVQLLRRSGCELECIRLSTDLKDGWKAQEFSYIRKLIYRPRDKDDISGLQGLNRNRVGGPEILRRLEVLEITDFFVTGYSKVQDLVNIVKTRLCGGNLFFAVQGTNDTVTYLKEISVHFADKVYAEYVHV